VYHLGSVENLDALRWEWVILIYEWKDGAK